MGDIIEGYNINVITNIRMNKDIRPTRNYNSITMDMMGKIGLCSIKILIMLINFLIR